MSALRLLGRAIVFAHDVLMLLGALYACFFAAAVALVAAWELLD